jgi:hypothetical protein
MIVSVLALLSAMPSSLVPIGKVSEPAIDEMSGIVASRRYPGLYWVHNDSGDSARVFAIRETGALALAKYENRKADAGKPDAPKPYEGLGILGATNTDWEDIAYDGENLYLCDTGNNDNARRDLTVYAVREPNPNAVSTAKAFAAYQVAYPDQKEFPPTGVWAFDCEAVVYRRGQLFFFTKQRISRLPFDSTAAYVLDLKKAKTDRVNVLKKLGEAKGLGGWVTAADVSPDGKTVAILTQAPGQSVHFFDMDQPNPLAKPLRTIKFQGGEQCEAVCFKDSKTLIITNEQRGIFRLAL